MLTVTDTKAVIYPETELAELRERVEHLAKRDEEITKRLRLHLVCLSTGVIITVMLTFLDVPPVIHFGGVFAGLPVYWQEFLDWTKGW
jgi:hypothetical protein